MRIRAKHVQECLAQSQFEIHARKIITVTIIRCVALWTAYPLWAPGSPSVKMWHGGGCLVLEGVFQLCCALIGEKLAGSQAFSPHPFRSPALPLLCRGYSTHVRGEDEPCFCGMSPASD